MGRVEELLFLAGIYQAGASLWLGVGNCLGTGPALGEGLVFLREGTRTYSAAVDLH